MRNSLYTSVTSGFRRDADEIWALQGYNAASSGKGSPLDAALHPRSAQIAYTFISIPTEHRVQQKRFTIRSRGNMEALVSFHNLP
jgi:hypothetical protein